MKKHAPGSNGSSNGSAKGFMNVGTPAEKLPAWHDFLTSYQQRAKLGGIICDENPYTRQAALTLVQSATGAKDTRTGPAPDTSNTSPGGSGTPPVNIGPTREALMEALEQVPMKLEFDDVRRDYGESHWEFKGGTYRVSRALRVSYTFEDAFGQETEEYVLIGYEGSGGYG